MIRSAALGLCLTLTLAGAAQAQYLNTDPPLGGFFDQLGRRLQEHRREERMNDTLREGLPTSEVPSPQQIGALIANPDTRQLGYELYLKWVGTPVLGYPTNQQLQILMANPDTHAFGEAIFRKKMGLNPAQ